MWGTAITFRRATLGRTPLDEWSARHIDLYLTTHNCHKRQTTIPPGEIRTRIPRRRAGVYGRLCTTRPTVSAHPKTPHSVGLLWTSDQPVTETSTWQHTTVTRDRQLYHRGGNSNPHSQEASGRRRTPCTTRPPVSAHRTLKGVICRGSYDLEKIVAAALYVLWRFRHWSLYPCFQYLKIGHLKTLTLLSSFT